MVKLSREEMLQLDVRGNVKLWTQLLGPKESLKVLGGAKKVLEILGPEKALEVLGPEKALEVHGPKKTLETLFESQGAAKIRTLLDQMEHRGNGGKKKPASRRKLVRRPRRKFGRP